MFAIIFLVFLFGYLPYGIIRMLDRKNSLHPDVYVLLTVIFIISISVSPIIYGLMNNQIRAQCVLLLKKLLNCAEENKDLSKMSNMTTLNIRRSIFQADSPTCNNREVNKDEELTAAKVRSGGLSKPDEVERVLLLRETQSENSENVAKTIRQEKVVSGGGGGSVSGSVKNQPLPSNESLNKSRALVIDKTDDGGIYKGPP
jgi:hypothetical protein